MNRKTILGYGMTIFGMCVLAIGLCAFVKLVPIETVPSGPECGPGCCPSIEDVMPPIEDYMTNPVVTPADNEMCGRYHLRKRTDRFFKRATA